MTETTSSSPPPASVPLLPPPAPQPKSRNVLLALLIVLILLMLGGASYFGLMQRDMLTRLAQLEIARSHASQTIDTLRSQLATQEKSLNDSQTLQTAAVERLTQQKDYLAQQLAQLASGTRTDWLLAEAEYLMRLANQRMNLERDPRGAEAILQAADQVLAEIADPDLFIIREQLAKEILAIQSVKPIDREQTFVQLQALADLLDKIEPGQFSNLTKLEAPTPEPAKDANTSLWQGIKADFLRVFHIQRLDQPIAPLLAPEQSYYLQQNLRLMLEQASHSLISQESELYQSALTKAENWLNQYFDSDNVHVQTMLNTLVSLKQARISSDTVPIAESLRLLRQHVETLQRQHVLTPNLAPAQLEPVQAPQTGNGE